MPHGVATYFRSQHASLDSTGANKKKKTAAALPWGLACSSTAIPDSTITSSASIRSVDAMTETRSERHFLMLNSARPSSKAKLQHVPAKLDVEIESPPLVFYGTPAHSSGALLSGQLKLNVLDEAMDIESLQMRLTLDVKMKKPFHTHCTECANQSNNLMSWTFLLAPAALSRGERDFPFSFLLPGHLPATTHGTLSLVDYVLRAQLTPKTGDSMSLIKGLSVKRSIRPSETPRHSVRVFPPTNLTAHVDLPSVIHPTDQFTASLRLSGLVTRNAESQTQMVWRLKKLIWHIEETQGVISPACPKHAAKAGAGSDEKKGIAHQDSRRLITQEVKNGWKVDYSVGLDASVEMAFPVLIRADSHPRCDVKAEDGTEISHVLILELIVAEEVGLLVAPSRSTPTGVARILRAAYNIVVTERSGVGVSWDEEQPPLYDDVPARPPGYGSGEECVWAPIPEYENLGREIEGEAVNDGSPARGGNLLV